MRHENRMLYKIHTWGQLLQLIHILVRVKGIISQYINILVKFLYTVLLIIRARISRPYKKLTIILLVVHLLNKIIVNFL